MVDDTDIRIVWRGIGRGLDRCFPVETDEDGTDPFADLLDALRARDTQTSGTDGGASA